MLDLIWLLPVIVAGVGVKKAWNVMWSPEAWRRRQYRKTHGWDAAINRFPSDDEMRRRADAHLRNYNYGE